MYQFTTVSVNSTPPTAEEALQVAALGITVIPLKPGTKEPCFKGWKQQASTDAQTLERWWRIYPGANVGGVLSRGHLVIDVDPRHGGLVGWRNLLAQHGDLPPTWKVWSGRQDDGFHLYLQTPADLDLPSVIDLAPGVQVLGPGHVVVLPPSLHPESHQPYAWDTDDCPATFLLEAPAPFWLIERILSTAQRHAKATAPAHGDTHKPLATPRVNKVLPEIPPPPSTLFNPPAQPSQSEKPGAKIAAVAAAPENLPALLVACGLDPTLGVGSALHCPMHDDEHPSAVVLGPSEKYASFGIFCHATSCQKYFSLVDLYKARESANILDLHPDETGQDHAPLRLLWLTRFLHAAGVLTFPKEWGTPSVPQDAPEDVQQVFRAFIDVRMLRSASRDLNAPLPFTLRFIQDWLGPAYTIGFNHAKKAKRALIHAGIIVAAGKDAAGEWLWRLGRMALRRARKDTPMLSPKAREAEIIADVAATVPVQSAPPPACPEAHERSHDARQCVYCINDRLIERRAQAGIWGDSVNPFGRGGGIATALIDEEPMDDE